MFFERKELCAGVHLNLMQTQKFKKNYISVNFILPHKKEYAALSSVLPDVLTRAAKKFPSLRLIEQELDECYSAQLTSYSSVKGASKIITVSIECLADHYAFNGESIFARSCDLLNEVLFYPYTENGRFSSDFVDSEKDKLLASVGRRKNSKKYYAIDSCKKIMCEGEAIGVPSYGDEEDIKNVSADMLFEFYKYVIDKADIELFYVGSESIAKVEKAFADMFEKKPRKKYAPQEYPQLKNASEVRYVCEDADYKQSVLVMGYRTNVKPDSGEKYAFSVFNAVFGSGVNSKLFRVVREKMHLCYYSSCSPEVAKGVAYITSGIDSSNEEITKRAIIEQLEATQNGEFSDEDIDDCKKALLNAYTELYDSADGLCSWYLGRVIYGDLSTIDDAVSGIEAVSREEIISAAKKMKLDTVFMLKGILKNGCDGEEAEV